MLHRADAPDRIITPRPDEIAGSTRTVSTTPIPSPARTTSSNIGTTRPTGATDAGAMRNTPIGRETVSTGTGARTHLGRRWNNFEDRLRNDRVRIVGACGICGVGPSSVAKDRDRDRKVG